MEIKSWEYLDPIESLAHHGVLGQKWGVRRYQNYDGTRKSVNIESISNRIDSVSLGRYKYDGTNDTAKNTLPYALKSYKKAIANKDITVERGTNLLKLLDSTSSQLEKLGNMERDLSKNGLREWVSHTKRDNRDRIAMAKEVEIVSKMDRGERKTTKNMNLDLSIAYLSGKTHSFTEFGKKEKEMLEQYGKLKRKYKTDNPIKTAESLVDSINVNDRLMFEELNRLKINYDREKQTYYNSDDDD